MIPMYLGRSFMVFHPLNNAGFFHCSHFPLENPPVQYTKTSSNGGCSIVMLVFGGVLPFLPSLRFGGKWVYLPLSHDSARKGS